jgi:hypothetical protein
VELSFKMLPEGLMLSVVMAEAVPKKRKKVPFFMKNLLYSQSR